MKQRYYRLYILLVGVALLAAGAALAIGFAVGARPLWLIAGGVLCLALLYQLWRGASFMPEQVKYFLGCLLSHDTMSRFPQTRDRGLQHMYRDMNRIMQTYGNYQMELETKRLYYDRILRIMTHELRNGITPIISLSEDMLRRDYSPADSREAVEVIHEQCTSVKRLLDSYYELTHLPKPQYREVEVRQMLLPLERLYPHHDITVQCAQGLRLRCDEGQIRQVINNLVKNAVEASATSVSIIASCPEGQPRICISDNGPGIPSSKLEEIFLPFYSTKPTGCGIGLALSRQIMNLHNGSLLCSSNETGGASFILQF